MLNRDGDNRHVGVEIGGEFAARGRLPGGGVEQFDHNLAGRIVPMLEEVSAGKHVGGVVEAGEHGPCPHIFAGGIFDPQPDGGLKGVAGDSGLGGGRRLAASLAGGGGASAGDVAGASDPGDGGAGGRVGGRGRAGRRGRNLGAQSAECLFRLGAGQFPHDLPINHQHEGRDAGDAKPPGQGLLFVKVNLLDGEPRPLELGDDRAHLAAGPTPLGGEVQDGVVGDGVVRPGGVRSRRGADGRIGPQGCGQQQQWQRAHGVRPPCLNL